MAVKSFIIIGSVVGAVTVAVGGTTAGILLSQKNDSETVPVASTATSIIVKARLALTNNPVSETTKAELLPSELATKSQSDLISFFNLNDVDFEDSTTVIEISDIDDKNGSLSFKLTVTLNGESASESRSYTGFKVDESVEVSTIDLEAIKSQITNAVTNIEATKIDKTDLASVFSEKVNTAEKFNSFFNLSNTDGVVYQDYLVTTNTTSVTISFKLQQTNLITNIATFEYTFSGFVEQTDANKIQLLKEFLVAQSLDFNHELTVADFVNQYNNLSGNEARLKLILSLAKVDSQKWLDHLNVATNWSLKLLDGNQSFTIAYELNASSGSSTLTINNFLSEAEKLANEQKENEANDTRLIAFNKLSEQLNAVTSWTINGSWSAQEYDAYFDAFNEDNSVKLVHHEKISEFQKFLLDDSAKALMANSMVILLELIVDGDSLSADVTIQTEIDSSEKPASEKIRIKLEFGAKEELPISQSEVEEVEAIVKAQNEVKAEANKNEEVDQNEVNYNALLEELGTLNLKINTNTTISASSFYAQNSSLKDKALENNISAGLSNAALDKLAILNESNFTIGLSLINNEGVVSLNATVTNGTYIQVINFSFSGFTDQSQIENQASLNKYNAWLEKVQNLAKQAITMNQSLIPQEFISSLNSLSNADKLTQVFANITDQDTLDLLKEYTLTNSSYLKYDSASETTWNILELRLKTTNPVNKNVTNIIFKFKFNYDNATNYNAMLVAQKLMDGQSFILQQTNLTVDDLINNLNQEQMNNSPNLINHLVTYLKADQQDKFKKLSTSQFTTFTYEAKANDKTTLILSGYAKFGDIKKPVTVTITGFKI